MANPFYVNPGNNLAGSYAQLGSTIQGIGQQQRQDEAAEKTRMRLNNFQQDYAKAVESGNPNALADLSIAYPEYQALAMQAFNITNENTGNAAAEAYMRALSDPNNADKHLFEGIQKVKSFGGTPTNMEQDLERFRQDPQASLQAIELGLAQAAPRAYKAFTERKMQAQKADITPYQQEQIDLKKQDQELRRLELEERNLDRQLARETKTEKIEELKAKKEQTQKAKQETERQDQSRISNAIYTANKNIQAVDDVLQNQDYIDALTGYRGRSPAISDEGREAETFFENIKNSMTIENLGAMSGPLTDKDIQIIASSASRLNYGMTDAVLKRELKKIKDSYKRVVSNFKKEANKKGYKLEGETQAPQTRTEIDILKQYGIE